MEKNKLQDFFNQIKNIAERYEKIQRLQGENFNIFSILGRESNEEKTHSNFLAELLNPKGSHGQKEIFLKKFIKILNEKDFIKNEEDENENGENEKRKWNLKNFNCENANVKTEKWIEKISFNEGRIDILITSENKKIVIENKIRQGEGKNQLEKYGEYLEKNTKEKEDRALLFLTLDGRKSDNHKNFKKYYRISYRDDILKWLQECRKEVATFPVIREGITHYINLIKKLTNQNTHNEMNEEIKKVVKENLETYKTIIDSYNVIINDLMREYFYQPIIEVIKEHFKDLSIGKNTISPGKYSGCNFNYKNYTIRFEFLKNYKRLIYGFYMNQPNHEKLKENLKKKDYKHTRWAGYKYFHKNRYKVWNLDTILKVKNNPEAFKNKIQAIFTELITAADEVERELQK